ncbi:hypothetical protein ACLINP_001992 [Vibrio cholerae]
MQYKILKRRIKDSLFGRTTNTALDVQVQEMADARFGAVYILANTDVKVVPHFSTEFVSNFIVGSEPIDDAKNLAILALAKSSAGRKVVSVVSIIGEATETVIRKIKGMISEFFQNLFQKVYHVYGKIALASKWMTEFATWAVAEFAGNISNCIPGWGYVQNAADIYSGVKQAIFKGKDLVTQRYAGRGVELLGGHPSVIAKALARHSLAGIAGGLKNAAVGITKTGLAIAGDALAGVGTLVSILSGIFERVVNIVDWLVQICLMNSTFEKAKKEWHNRGSKTSMVNNHQAFSEWFQSVVIHTPVIAAVVMGSGFVAHPYKFLQLVTANGKVKSQSDFDKGIKYIKKLKKRSVSYVQEYTDAYSVDFTSQDGLVAARLIEIKTGKGILDGEEFVVAVTQPLPKSQSGTASANP